MCTYISLSRVGKVRIRRGIDFAVSTSRGMEYSSTIVLWKKAHTSSTKNAIALNVPVMGNFVIM